MTRNQGAISTSVSEGWTPPTCSPLGISGITRGRCQSPLPEQISFDEYDMHFNETCVFGAQVIDPSPHKDNRGRFMRAWCSREFREHGLDFLPVQANMGFSFKKGTIRGMHFQETPALEAKLVRCTRGSMFDVALDLRLHSQSYGKWYGIELSAENGRMLYVPEGCAHGYQTLEEETEMYYMASQFYTPSAARGVRYDDPSFNIQWPLAATVVSEHDLKWPLYGEQI